MPPANKWVKWGLVFVFLTALILLYVFFDPASAGWFPRCPFRVVTGLQCPGCGSQRAVHHLLHGDLGKAMGQNILLVLAIPYLLTGFIFDMVRTPGEKFLVWRKRLFGRPAIWTVFGIIILFWILRNLPFFYGYL